MLRKISFLSCLILYPVYDWHQMILTFFIIFSILDHFLCILMPNIGTIYTTIFAHQSFYKILRFNIHTMLSGVTTKLAVSNCFAELTNNAICCWKILCKINIMVEVLFFGDGWEANLLCISIYASPHICSACSSPSLLFITLSEN